MSIDFHIVLPPRERYSPAGSGAVALVVHDFYLASRNRERIRIYGGAQPEQMPGVDYHAVPPSRLRLTSRTRNYAIQISRLIPDTPHTYIEVHNRVEVFLRIRERHAHSRISLYLHNDPDVIGGLGTSAARKRILEQADAVICVSDFVRGRFLLDVDSPARHKARVIPNAVPTAGRDCPRAPANPLILYVGRMVPEKGVRQLAEALADVLPQHPDWRAMFIGASRHGGGTASALEKDVRSRRSRRGGRIEWTGQLPNAEVQMQMRKASIVVIPSICTEAFPRVAIEAMINGCAVISSGRGGLAEATGQAAEVVDPENPADIAAALQSLIADPKRLLDMRRAGCEYVKLNFDIEQVSARLDSLRESLLGAPA